MLDLTKTGFAELSCEEMTEVDGGFAWALIGRCAIKVGKVVLFLLPKMYTYVE